MRLRVLLASVIFSAQLAGAQIYEVGVFGGGSNVIGDVGRTEYISPNQVAYGAIFKWNRSPRHSFRASFLYSDISGDDRLSDDPRRQQRRYSFRDGLFEISAGMEFTFWEFNLHEIGPQSTPYLYTGFLALNHENYYFDAQGEYTSEGTDKWAYGIPIILGYKMRITQHTILGLEAGARYTFTDQIDGSVPENPDLEQYRFGNINNNDWYMFVGFTVTYTFGQRPCYCDYW